MQHICLIGFMGSGKTTVGQAVAKQLEKPWVDLDTYIVGQAGKSISQIFNEQGEHYFRELEAKCLKEVIKQSEGVISTGGGIITQLENIKLLQSEITIYLAYPFEILFERIAGDPTRPLATSYESLKIRFEDRLALYEETCQIKVDCAGKSINYIAQEIINEVKYNT